MRGKVGDKLTICGDWLYDWAKIYQSIIGYDEILLSKFMDININKFLEQDFVNIKNNYKRCSIH